MMYRSPFPVDVEARLQRTERGSFLCCDPRMRYLFRLRGLTAGRYPARLF